jgi:DNA-binding MarR family transcriptional regulator
MSSTTNQDELRSDSIFKLQTTGNLIAKYSDRVFNSKISISQPKFAVLFVIDTKKYPVNQSIVAGRLQIGINTLSMMIERLVKTGLVERTRSESDRRENYLTLTPAGKDKLVKGIPVNKSMVSRLTKTFTETEVQEFTRLLTKLEKQILKEIGDSDLSK